MRHSSFDDASLLSADMSSITPHHRGGGERGGGERAATANLPDFPIVSVWNRQTRDLILASCVFGAQDDAMGLQADQREAFFLHPSPRVDSTICDYCFDTLIAFLKGEATPDCRDMHWALDTDRRWPMFLRWRKRMVAGVVDEEDFSERQFLTAGIASSLLPRPLNTFQELVFRSAADDPHCVPIALEDVPYLECNAMVVTCMEAARDMTDWELGVHGILVSFEDYKGVVYGESYLPDVPVICGWTKEHTINQLMQKAGSVPRLCGCHDEPLITHTLHSSICVCSSHPTH